jgi:hypothetical protein
MPDGIAEFHFQPYGLAELIKGSLTRDFRSQFFS